MTRGMASPPRGRGSSGVWQAAWWAWRSVDAAAPRGARNAALDAAADVHAGAWHSVWEEVQDSVSRLVQTSPTGGGA